jgi:hypothetical protein
MFKYVVLKAVKSYIPNFFILKRREGGNEGEMDK